MFLFYVFDVVLQVNMKFSDTFMMLQYYLIAEWAIGRWIRTPTISVFIHSVETKSRKRYRSDQSIIRMKM